MALTYSLSHLNTGDITTKQINNQKQWETIYQLLELNTLDPVHLTKTPEYYVLAEKVSDDYRFLLNRYMNGHRETKYDDLGIIGLSRINPKDLRVIVTEGVSDYATAALTWPRTNVIGLTTLGGNKVAKSIMGTLFKKYIYLADNDQQKEINTGMVAAIKFKKFAESIGAQFKIEIPAPGYGDFTDEFIFNLKLQIANKT